MKNIVILFLCLQIFASCNQAVQAPLPSSNNYCHLLEGIQPNKAAPYQDLDSLITQDKTGVFVLEEGEEAITSRAYLSQNVEETMDIQYFIFSEDNIGIISCDYMLRAACRGVKVRLLIDDLMIDVDTDYMLALDQHENVDIKIYNPNLNIGKNLVYTLFKTTTDFRGINQRMHHKTFIVDGKIAITGGRNIADEYFDYDHEYNFRDRDVLLVGGEAATVQDAFDQYWESELSVSISDLIGYTDDEYDPHEMYHWVYNYTNDPSNFWPEIRARIPQVLDKIIASDRYFLLDRIEFVSDDPGKNDGSEGLLGGGNTTKSLIDLVSKANKSVHIQSPYLIVTDLGLDLFKSVIERGVEVNITTNSLASTDNLEAFSGYQRNRKELLNAGINLYEYKPNAAIRLKLMKGDLQKRLNFVPTFGLHAKSMVVDDSISVVGTFNLDPRSANLNTECVTILYSKEINNNMKSIMETEQKPENSWHVTSEFNPDSAAGRWKRFQTWTRRVIPKSIL